MINLVICASIGTRVYEHVMSHNFNSLLVLIRFSEEMFTAGPCIPAVAT